MRAATEPTDPPWQHCGENFAALLEHLNSQFAWRGTQIDVTEDFHWRLNLTQLKSSLDGSGHCLTVGHFITTGGFVHQGGMNLEDIVVATPVRGTFRLCVDGAELAIGPGQLAIYQPTTETFTQQYTDGSYYEVYYVKMSAGFARKFLAQALHFPIVGPLRLQQVVNRGEPAHDMLAEIIATLSSYNFAIASRRFSLSLQRKVIETFGQILLESAPHPYRERMKITHDGPLPRHVRLARQYMQANALSNPKAEDIAKAAQVSLRTLETSFRSFLHMSPTAYLRTLRLRMARDLLLYEGTEVSVETVARRFGFRHTGRFSRYYSELFGESPSETRRGWPNGSLSKVLSDKETL